MVSERNYVFENQSVSALFGAMWTFPERMPRPLAAAETHLPPKHRSYPVSTVLLLITFGIVTMVEAARGRGRSVCRSRPNNTSERGDGDGSACCCSGDDDAPHRGVRPSTVSILGRHE